MANLERKEYLAEYYKEFITFMKSLTSHKSNVLHITINSCKISTGKVKGVDEILVKGIKDLFDKALLEIEKEIINDLTK